MAANLPVPRAGGQSVARRLHIEVRNVEKVDAAFEAMIGKTVEATGLMVSWALHRIARQERTMLSLGRHPPGTRTGSVPPEPPWRISGHLSRSVTVDEPVLRNFKWSGRMGPTAVYARIHELGGWTGAGYRTYLPPRPHLKPAWELARPWIYRRFGRGWSMSTRPPRL